MGYVTSEQISQAREIDLLTYLQTCEPQELVHVSGDTYCTREHDSLKISNGKWHWWSRDMGGRTALDYLIKVQGYSLPQAVEAILGRAAAMQPVSRAPPPKKETPRKLLLPELNDSTQAVYRYLAGRGIHPSIIDYCIDHKLLFETKQYHNALFVGYDPQGKARYAALRGTMGDFKGDVSGSDKRYSFSVSSRQESPRLHLFESAIDLLSYATLSRRAGRDWRTMNLLSLAGVFKTKRKNVVPVALERYLQDYPHIQTLHLHLDNDEVGRRAAEGILGGLSGKYTVLNQPPPWGKDCNDYLMHVLARERARAEYDKER